MDSTHVAGSHDADSEPSVTVVVATRDRPEMLRRAVRSILEQAYPGKIECVLVFDQSRPESVDIEAPKNRQIRILTNSRSPGLAGARNTGIVKSQGELVAFCDDDDVWDRAKLRRQVELLRSSSAEVAACGVRIHYDDRVIERTPPRSVEFHQLIRSRVTAVHPSTFVILRSSLDGIGLVDEDIPGSYGEDYDFLLRAARRAPVVAVEEPLVDVHWHPQSFFTQGWQARVEALEYLMDKHPEFRADRHGLARMEGRIAFAEAALARRRAACRSGWRSIRSNPLERRAYVALAVASGIVPAASVMRLANQRGRGV